MLPGLTATLFRGNTAMTTVTTNPQRKGDRKPALFFAAIFILIVGVPSALAATSSMIATPAPAALSVEG